ncbi:MAG: SDR family oxidoreductase [Polaribacter sp.]|jgi:dTDP-4-dehydrorhamnose reductase|uniref:SDR family oxidoreductase n=1 Tax=Polaribacter sp. TaxID=1920175 RepID=UPI00384E0EF4
MKKVIITGSNGLLGQSLLKLLLKERTKYEVFGFSRGVNRSDREDFTYCDMDITKEVLLKDEIDKIQPDFIINTAAMTQVDACETQKEACYLLNVTVVKWLTEICELRNIHLVQISTDFIFDGKKGHYKETDTPNPISYYGRSKLNAEAVIKTSAVQSTILRTSLVYGKVPHMTRSNIVLWVKKMLEEKNEVTIVSDQFRAPTYVIDLALACKISIDSEVAGVFNICSNKILSIYEIAQQVAQVFELDENLIKPISTAVLNQTAFRPPKTGFDLTKTNNELQFYPKSFKEDLLKFKETFSENYI